MPSESARPMKSEAETSLNKNARCVPGPLSMPFQQGPVPLLAVLVIPLASADDLLGTHFTLRHNIRGAAEQLSLPGGWWHAVCISSWFHCAHWAFCKIHTTQTSDFSSIGCRGVSPFPGALKCASWAGLFPGKA